MKDINQAERLLVVRRKRRMKEMQAQAQQNSQMQAQQAQQAAQAAAKASNKKCKWRLSSKRVARVATQGNHLEAQLEQVKHELEKRSK